MTVAHEFDPYNDVWISQWNRAEPYGEPHLEIARRLKAAGLLYPGAVAVARVRLLRILDGGVGAGRSEAPPPFPVAQATGQDGDDAGVV